MNDPLPPRSERPYDTLVMLAFLAIVLGGLFWVLEIT